MKVKDKAKRKSKTEASAKDQKPKERKASFDNLMQNIMRVDPRKEK